ncbi:TetR-like C-terminal domain-containing protein [Nocardia sp. NPDC006044]|uniref:TetR-like C-terminal domain-containing protein n=1 Tax=Nocardia sp. NPDC006044 TaxID=3364306 RepID=UPI0036952315
MAAFGLPFAEPYRIDAIRLLHGTFYGYVTLENTGRYDTNPRNVEASWRSTLDAVLKNWPTASR